ncbi:MAG: FHA domain-containing protein [Muribaculaceae bacterium]|nr:FHA domain-containing protein [Muribaculaceae bacterium]
MEIIIGRQGNQKTLITDPTVSRKHCKVTDNGDGTYTIENLSPSGTKVDGVEIIRTTAKLNSRIQLGQSFSATLEELIGVQTVSPLTNQSSPTVKSSNPSGSRNQHQEPAVKTYDISHLRKVWDDFNNTNLEMANRQRKVSLVRSATPIFTIGSGLLASLTELGTVGWMMTGIGGIGFLYSLIGMKNAETPEERQRRQEEFEDAWVCPNPECGHSLMAKNYKMLVRNHQSCPYCKCKYVEK